MTRTKFRFTTIGGIAAMFALATVGAVTANATDITFAEVSEAAGLNQWSITTVGDTTTISVTNGNANFTFYDGPLAGTPQTASFTFSASSSTIGNCGLTPCTPPANDTFTQSGYTGSFTYTDTEAGADDGKVLLSGIFITSPSGGELSSTLTSSGGSFDVSGTNLNNQLVLSSDFLTFNDQTEEDASFALSSLNPSFSIVQGPSGQGYPSAGTLTAAGAGTFSSNPGIAPEPASFVLIGGGLIGLGLLRRRKLLHQ